MKACFRLRRLAPGALMALLATVGAARADSDGITNLFNVPVPAIAMSGGGGPTGCTPTSFSFDISWVDPFVHSYTLADRTHGGAANGDILFIDITNPSAGARYFAPTADPFAGIRCDQNAAFGGSAAAGRNEITGPNGNFTVNHAEVWAGDGPSDFALAVPQTNTAADYNNDPCDSSVRVFDIATGNETDHINVGGCFRTDEGAFDPVDQIALFANPSEQPGIKNGKALNQSAFVTLISTVPVAGGPVTSAGPTNRHKILKQINFDGTHGTPKADMGIEQAVYSPKTGMFYISIPGSSTNAAGYVTVLDPRGDADHIHVVTNFKLSGNCVPNGAALGPDYELLLGCNAAGAAEQVIDIRDGHLIRTLTGTAGGCDEVTFNAGDDSFYGACTDTHPPVDNLDISDADPGTFDAAINTGASGAHSVAADPVTVTEWDPMFAGLCGAGVACVQVFGSTGGDDASEAAQEAAEDHHFDRHHFDDFRDHDFFGFRDF